MTVLFRTFRFFFLITTLLLTFCPFAQAQTLKAYLSSYKNLLKTYVDDQGLVDYQGLKAHREKLDQAVEAFGSFNPQSFKSWNDPDQITFFLNAYNLFTL